MLHGVFVEWIWVCPVAFMKPAYGLCWGSSSSWEFTLGGVGLCDVEGVDTLGADCFVATLGAVLFAGTLGAVCSSCSSSIDSSNMLESCRSAAVKRGFRSNAIIVKALKNNSYESMLDDQCSKAVVKQIKKAEENIIIAQNAAERAIQTWKDHWTSRNGHVRSKLPNAALVPIHRTRPTHLKRPANLKNQSKIVSLRRPRRQIQLQLNSASPRRYPSFSFS
eukprot:scaffold31709_cov41-Cyclotella_meneghiniana.AAC.13